MTTTDPLRRMTTLPWLRRLLRTRTDRLQNLWSALLVAATVVACGWIANADVPGAAGQQRPALRLPG